MKRQLFGDEFHSTLARCVPWESNFGEEDCDNHHTVTRYIEAKSGQVFEIKIEVKQGATRGAGLEFRIFVDGKDAGARIISCEDVQDSATEYVLQGWEDVGRQFKFSKLKTLDSTNKGDRSRSMLEGLGSFQTEIYHLSRIIEGKQDEQEDDTDKKRSVPKTTRTVHETAIKGRMLSHSVGYGRAIKDEYREGVDVEYLVEDPIAIFQFLYRSGEALEAEHVLPRTPSPPPFEERPFQQMDEKAFTEMQKMYKEMKEKESAHRKIKQEAHPSRVKDVKGGDYAGHLEPIDAVSEKEIKGQIISHTTGFDAASKQGGRSGGMVTAVSIGKRNSPHAIYVFKYRSVDVSKAMMIISRTPSPEPEVPLEERDFDTLTPTEQREVFKRMQKELPRRSRMLNVKREHADGDSRPRRRAAHGGDRGVQVDKKIIEIDWNGAANIDDALPGVEVEITVAEQPLKEYVEDDAVDEANTNIPYVEARSGQEFEVRCKAHRSTDLKGDKLSFRIRMDGRTASKKSISASHFEEGETAYCTASYTRISTDQVRGFEFASL
ncbi:hypothetical protein DOTSEDRAFT_29616 [Dothistroma septosporum NZE10]|uniref:DUF7918 domain-containing protein n=1 Tax=Dothistroma septosporum (strain NZE10 / CBS 128990) TaxID=675120 RepID=N1PEN1_DOTSN|nr:hypothetical protein DOTSEDRAFT_29616 [Dothistroma septosporum NZE10]